MGRIQKIEDLVAGTLPFHNNLKLIMRGRPRYLDPQLDGGYVRFAVKRGFNFTGIIPDNQSYLSEDAFKEMYELTLYKRPTWIKIGSLIRIGQSDTVGELQLVADIVGSYGIMVARPLVTNYLVADGVTYVTLLGVSGSFFQVSGDPRRVLSVETPHPMVPGDVLMLSASPDVLESFADFKVKRAKPTGTRPGIPAIGEPDIMYQYEVEVVTQTGLLPFTPSQGMRLFLKAHPFYYRDGYGSGDLRIPSEIGPCLLDAYSGSLLINHPTITELGIQTWDSFGTQINAAQTDDQPWQMVPKNHLILERPISSDQLLFWQRIRGQFQFKQAGYFQAELDAEGQFVISTDTLVPRWPTDIQRGWVIPFVSEGALRVSVQFEPQPPQYFDVLPHALTFLRPKIMVGGPPIQRLILSILGSPNSRVEIRTWQYDGSAVESLNYFMLGTGPAFGDDKWISGGLCLKPLFSHIDVLKARYSDGVSRYNAGYTYV